MNAGPAKAPPARSHTGDSPTLERRAFQSLFFEQQPSAKDLFELFEYLPSAYFYAKDSQHRYVGANHQVLREVFGLDSIDELLGKTDLDFQPPVLAEAYHAEDRRVMESGVTLAKEVWLVPHVQGSLKWYVSSKTPIHDPSGAVIGIAGVMYRVDTPKDRSLHFRDLTPVISLIENRFTDDLSIREMAENVGLSSTQFNARFREILRMSPTEYIQKLRVETAQQLLIRSDKSIAAISSEVGFYDQSHFTKRFKRTTGLTPLAYRKRFR